MKQFIPNKDALMQTLTVVGVFCGSLIFLIFAARIVAAFTPPGQPPPGGNTPPPLQKGAGPLDITDGVVNERDIIKINKLVGYNDLFLWGDSSENSAIYYSGSEHKFYTKTGGSTYERLNIANNGDILVGLPDIGNQKTLNIRGAGAGSSEGGEMRLDMAADYDTTYDYWRIDVFSDDLRFGPQGTTQLTITEVGNVGIGYDTPPEKLSIGSGGDILLNSGSLITPTGGMGTYQNIAVYSEQLDNWGNNGNSTVVTSNSIIAPDQTQTAEKIQDNTAVTFSVQTRNDFTGLSPVGKTYTLSVWVKGNVVALAYTLYLFNQSDATRGSATYITTTEWQRVSVTGSYVGGDTTVRAVMQWNALQGDFSKEIHAWGVQLEEASSPGVYAKREAVQSTLRSNGLIVQSTGPHAFLNGNVGIGTMGPGAKLEVSAGALGGTVGSEIEIQRNIFTTGNTELLRVYGKRSATGADWTTGDYYIQRRVDVSDQGFVKFTDYDVAFGTGTNEIMRIDNTGNVGIGYNAPNNKLHIRGRNTADDGLDGGGIDTVVGIYVDDEFNNPPTNTTADTGLYVQQNNTAGWAAYFKGRVKVEGNLEVVGQGAAVTKTGSPAARQVTFWSDGNSVTGDANFVFDTAGRLGIGTATPAKKLEIENGGLLIESSPGIANTGPFVSMAVNGYSATEGTFRFEDIRNPQAWPSFVWNVAGNSGGIDAYSFLLGGLAGVVIEQGGNVGINRNDPGAKLTVNNPNNPGKTGSATDAIYTYANNPTGAAISAEQANAAGFAGYFSGKTAFMDGNVGIGYNAPNNKLHIRGRNTADDGLDGGGIDTAVGIYADDDVADTGLYVQQNNAAGWAAYFKGRVKVDGNLEVVGQGAAVTKTGSPAARQVTFWSDGNSVTGDANFVFDTAGRLGIGTATPGTTLDVRGNLTILAGSDIRPTSDSISAINIANAAGADFVRFDTTNQRVGIGPFTPEVDLHLRRNVPSTIRISDSNLNVAMEMATNLSSQGVIGTATAHTVVMQSNGQEVIRFLNTPVTGPLVQVGAGSTGNPHGVLEVAPAAITVGGEYITFGSGRGALPTTRLTLNSDILNQRENYFSPATLDGDVPGRTITNAATVYIAGAPIAGTNMTINNPYAFWVASGTSRFDGNVGINTIIAGAKLTVNNPNTPLKTGSAGDAIYTYANSANAAISAEQGNVAGYAGYFSGKTAFMDGNVGIGYTTPNNKLHIRGRNTADDGLDGGGVSTAFGVYADDDAADTALYAQANNPSGWAGYFSGNVNVEGVARVYSKSTPGAKSQTSDTDFNAGTLNQTTVVGANNAADVILADNPAGGNVWTPKASLAGEQVDFGGALVYPSSGDYVYAFTGNTTDKFWRYSISGDAWTPRANTPRIVACGGALVHPGSGDFIYGFSGSGWNTFWRYSISGDVWIDRASINPGSDGVWCGGALVYPGSGDYIYGHRGDSGPNKRDFQRYSITNDTWSPMSPTPTDVLWFNGFSLASPGGNYIYALKVGGFAIVFWRYSIAEDKWESLPAPGIFNLYSPGATLAYPGTGDYLYALIGADTTYFERYSITGNTWQGLASTPNTVNDGGALAAVSADRMFALRGKSTPEFWQYTIRSVFSSGTLTSSDINASEPVNFANLTFNVTTPPLTALKFQLRSAPTQAGLTSAVWYGPTGVGDYYTTSGTSINSVHDNHQWIQYRAFLDTTNTFVTPRQHDITINYVIEHGTAFYITQEGRVGIGTETPLSKLHIKAGPSWGSDISLDAADLSGGRRWTVESTGGTAQEGQGKFIIKDMAANKTRIAIDTNGNVGLGLDSPNAGLVVNKNVSQNAGKTGDGIATIVNSIDSALYAEQQNSLGYAARLSGNVALVGDLGMLGKLDVSGTAHATQFLESKDNWTGMAGFPSSVSSGGALAYTGRDYIYGFRGNTSNMFQRYSISNNSWTARAGAPSAVAGGGSLVYTGGGYIYALRGNPSSMFWRYSISTDSWNDPVVADPVLSPGGVGSGGSLVYTGGDYIYALQGNNTITFLRYSISGNSWTNMTVAPSTIGAGASLVYTGGDYIYTFRGNTTAGPTNTFWRYSISGDSWTAMTAAPSTVTGGGSLVYSGGDYIYAVRGSGSTAFWRYSISNNSWTSLTGTPIIVGNGGSLVYVGNNYIYALTGNISSTFLRYSGASDQKWNNLAASGVSTLAGSGANRQIVFWTGANSLGGDAGFIFDASGRLSVNQTSPVAKLVVNNPQVAGKTGSAGDALYAYANSTNAAISAEQANAAGWAGYFSGNVQVTSKLTVSTIDPEYEIDGKKYATYVSDFAGGVRTETSGIVVVKNGSYVIDFDELEAGSDLWLLWKTSTEDVDTITIALTPAFEGRVWYNKEKSKNQIIIFSDKDGEVSFRLTAPREDSDKWKNEIK